MNERDRLLAARRQARYVKGFYWHFILTLGALASILLIGGGESFLLLSVALPLGLSLVVHFLLLATGLLQKLQERNMRILLEMLEEEDSHRRLRH